ncbi:MAG TPA: MBL fold metallo-hydrolase [Solirubrobacteraceae bacterium]|nr:MBL fold metallo-hydrolase [Solirubrobacteraceae bacterium]
MRAVALHEDVIVFVSDMWQTTCTALRGDDEGFVIDSPLYPEELRALPEVLEQSKFPVSGLLATHGDWDHLLGRLAFPDAALGGAESTVARVNGEPGDAQRRLRTFDEQHYVPDRGPLGLGALQGLPVPGRLEVGTRGGPAAAEREQSEGGTGEAEAGRELEMLPADGHTGDGAAYWLPWVRVLVCGDYLSPVEIPMISADSGGTLAAYRATLARFSGYVEQAEWVVPGHGAPLSGTRAAEILREDDEYLAELQRQPASARPPASRGGTATQQRIHDANVAAVTGATA